MSTKARITHEYFNVIKNYVRWHTTKHTARRFGLSEKTVFQIRGARNYGEYREQVRSQHPPINSSLRDMILELHDLTFNKHDNTYIKPEVARKAAAELIANASL